MIRSLILAQHKQHLVHANQNCRCTPGMLTDQCPCMLASMEAWMPVSPSTQASPGPLTPADLIMQILGT
jgi:hypothetical protein